MARTTATNFSGGLQFPYATAATDAFHKEDIQTLAQAVDQHVHDGTGKGLAIAAAAAGSITSAMIADGTIVTADLAANAATRVSSATGVTGGPATTSASITDIPDMTLTLSSVPANTIYLAILSILASVSVDAGNSEWHFQLNGVDGGPYYNMMPKGNLWTMLTFFQYGVLATGTNTIKGRWKSDGTISIGAVSNVRNLHVVEFRR